MGVDTLLPLIGCQAVFAAVMLLWGPGLLCTCCTPLPACLGCQTLWLDTVWACLETFSSSLAKTWLTGFRRAGVEFSVVLCVCLGGGCCAFGNSGWFFWCCSFDKHSPCVLATTSHNNTLDLGHPPLSLCVLGVLAHWPHHVLVYLGKQAVQQLIR